MRLCFCRHLTNTGPRLLLHSLTRRFSSRSLLAKTGGIMTTEPSTSRLKRSSSSTESNGEPSSKKRHNPGDDTEEAITKDEVDGTETPVAAQSAASTKPRNAFSELMSPKPKSWPLHKTKKPASFRDNLGIYLTNPSSLPPSAGIIFHNDHFVAIHDLYPKATIHTLLLPRNPKLNRLHPFDALSSPENADFLASVRGEAARLKDLVAKDLQRRLGRFSTSADEARRNAILDGSDPPPPEEGQADALPLDAEGHVVLPPGRDWIQEIKVGVHAVPSMNHLHIHVLSRDMHSDKMKHRKHYNSFTTDFFVPLDDFPLSENDWRRKSGAQRSWPERPMVCWRCGMDFGNRFKDLKRHLEHEFDEWKRE